MPHYKIYHNAINVFINALINWCSKVQSRMVIEAPAKFYSNFFLSKIICECFAAGTVGIKLLHDYLGKIGRSP